MLEAWVHPWSGNWIPHATSKTRRSHNKILTESARKASSTACGIVGLQHRAWQVGTEIGRKERGKEQNRGKLLRNRMPVFFGVSEDCYRISTENSEVCV